MITAEFIDSSIEGWLDSIRVEVGKKTIIGSPDIYVGVDCQKIKYLIEVYTFDEVVCFQSLRLVESNVIFGFGSNVHFFNTASGSIKSFELDTYFGHLYIAEDLEYTGEDFGILVASAEFLHRFTPNGEELWKSPRIGIDGVTVSNIVYPEILAQGEWDPPGGWVDIKLNLENGEKSI